MLTAIQIIAERKISEAIREGTLNTTAWKNRPLPQDTNPFMPAELRMGYTILKNSGYLPPEIETKKEISRLEELIAKNHDEHTRIKQLKKLDFLILKLNSMRRRPCTLKTMTNTTAR